MKFQENNNYNIKVLYYAKQRYEQTLSKYDSSPSIQSTDNLQVG